MSKALRMWVWLPPKPLLWILTLPGDRQSFIERPSIPHRSEVENRWLIRQWNCSWSMARHHFQYTFLLIHCGLERHRRSNLHRPGDLDDIWGAWVLLHCLLIKPNSQLEGVFHLFSPHGHHEHRGHEPSDSPSLCSQHCPDTGGGCPPPPTGSPVSEHRKVQECNWPSYKIPAWSKGIGVMQSDRIPEQSATLSITSRNI